MDMIAYLRKQIETWEDVVKNNKIPGNVIYAEGKISAYKDVLSEVIKGYLEV